MDELDSFVTARASPESRLKRSHFGLETGAVDAATPSEVRLLAVWQEVLGIEGLGVEDDFFRLGGDSFQAVTLFGEIERAFGQSLPLPTLLDYPTVRQLAGYLDGSRKHLVDKPLVALKTDGWRTPIFFVHAIKGHVLFVARLAPHLAADQPVYALQARGLEPGETPHDRFDVMGRDYVAAIRRVQLRGPYHLAGYCAGSLTALEMARQLRAAGEEVDVLALIDPEDHPSVVPWLYWRNPDTLRVRVFQPLLRLKIAIRRLFRRTFHDYEPGRRWRYTAGPRELAIRRGIMAALKTYRPLHYAGPLTIFTTQERRASLGNPTRGWPRIAPQAVLIELGRWHTEIFNEKLPLLGQELQRVVDEAASRRSVHAAPSN